MTTDVIEAPATPWRERRLPVLALLLVVGAVWWLVGFLPWLLDGLGNEMLDGGGPITYSPMALPLISGNLSALVLGAGVGSVAAGLVTLLAHGTAWQRAGAAGGGVAVALLATLVESRRALQSTNLDSFGTDSRVVDGLSLIVVATTVVGLALGLLALTGRVGLGLGLAALAGALPMWVANVARALTSTEAGNVQHSHDVTRWIGAAVLVAALVVIGLRPAVRALGWVAAVLLAWFIGPTVTAAGYVEVLLRPGMGLPDALGDHLSATADVWRMAASPGSRSWVSWVVAIAVAGALVAWREARVREQASQ